LKTRGHHYFSQWFFHLFKISNKRETFGGKIGLKIFELFLKKKKNPNYSKAKKKEHCMKYKWNTAPLESV